MLQFISDHHLQATPNEIAEYYEGLDRLRRLSIERKNQRIKRIKQELSRSGLTKREQADLEGDLKSSQQSLKTDEDVSKRASTMPACDPLTRFFVESWKFNRALNQKYGGGVIQQQAGIEPLDPMQKWLEEQEQARNFTILDPKVRDSFYNYYHLRRTKVTEKNAFDKPWWLMEPDKEHDIRFGKKRVPPVPETLPSDAGLR